MKYCGFTHKELIQDHKELKKQIKQREKQLDTIGIKLLNEYTAEDIDETETELNYISQEMMSINM